MNTENTNYNFLQGGGEMGKLIRAKDWRKTPLGDPKTWPQSLRTMVSVVLDNPFGMYIAWGKEYTQIYNDGYRPILGASKHPQALGISSKETFSEIWHIIDTMFEGVMNGEAVGFPDFMLPLDRNGYVETCYFDFAYSPIRLENGEVGGVLVTVIETTNKKKAEEELIESKNELEFVLEAAQLGTFDYNPHTKKFSGNARLKSWFGLPPEDQIELSDAINVISETDRKKVATAIQTALDYSSGGIYDIVYSIIQPISKKEIIIHAKGKAWFDEEKIAYRLNGTLEDITEQALANRKRKETEQHIRTMVLESPVGICVMDAATLISEIANDSFIEIAGKPHDAIVGKFYWDTFAEARAYYEEPMKNVVETGKPFYANEVEMMLIRHGKEDIIYVTFVYAPLKDENGKVIKIAVWVLENTPQVEARKKIMISENNLRLMILQAPMAISILRGSDYKVEIANKYALELWGRTEEEVMNIPVFESMPELSTQGIKELLDDVTSTGNRFATAELPVQFLKNGTLETVYINFSYEALYDADGKIDGIMAIGFDVTPQVEARKKVEESEQRFRNLIAQAIHPIFILRGEELTLEIANDSLFKFWRVGPDAIGKPFLDLLPEMKGQPYYDLLMDVLHNGVTHYGNEQPTFFSRPNGEEYTLYFNFIYQPFREADGNISGVLVQAYDVTEQVFARKKIEESEQRTRSLVESAPFPIAVYVGKEMRIALANQSVMDIWGKGNDVVGKLYTDILPELVGQKIFEQVAAVLETGMPFHAKNQKVDLIKNGALGSYYFNYSFTPLFDASGIPYAVMNTAAEVTELHEAKQRVEESEKRFRDSVEQAPLGIAIFRGPDFKVELANENYLLLVDKKESEFIGKPLFEALPEVKSLVEPLFRDVISSGNAFYSPELPATLNRYGSMEQAYFNLVYHPLKEESGEISGIMVVATEVTTTAIAKHLLEESEKHFRHMVMQSPIPMTILRGKDYIIESANKVMFENMWRKKEADVLGKSILDVFPELKEQKYPELLNKVFTTGKSHTEKESLAYVQGDDGMKKFYLDFEYAALFEPDGKISGIMITVNDVTDKVEARQKVEEAEERSRLAAEATELATWELDLHSRHIIHSPRLAVIFGHDESAIITHLQMRSQIHPEDIHDIVEKAFDEAMITGIYSYEARVVKPDNSFCWIRTQGKVFFDENRKPIKKLGTLRDITEEKQYQQALVEREQKFRLLADSMPQHIWTSDKQGNLNYFNQSVFDFSGLTLDQINKDGWIQIVHPEDREENIRLWTEAISTGKDFIYEHRFRKHNGEYRWQLSRATPQKDNDGNIKMWVGSSTDIQDQKMFTTELESQVQQRTNELNQKNIDLERINKELQSFVYISSHDLQEPLRKIQTFSSRILESEYASLSYNAKKYFSRMQQSANRMQNLIQDLFAYSRTTSHERKFEIVNLLEIIDDIKETLKEELEQNNVTFELHNICDVKIISFQFKQLILNLISNSIKFARVNHPLHIKIECEIAAGAKFGIDKLSDENQYCHISISDNGIGFEQQYNERIFEVFQRLHGKEEYNGTGIGLAIVKKIVENHDGIITAFGEVNKGATFNIFIPV